MTLRNALHYLLEVYMNKYWLIREFSKLTGVTVRTLHYYDEQGILKPHHKNHSGYRFYSHNELTYLQKISALKYMGFNLNQIKNMLLNNQSDWLKSLNTQANLIQNNISKLQHRLIIIDQSINNPTKNNQIDLQNINNFLITFMNKENNLNNKNNKQLSS